jgi:hypothetical protein
MMPTFQVVFQVYALLAYYKVIQKVKPQPNISEIQVGTNINMDKYLVWVNVPIKQ